MSIDMAKYVNGSETKVNRIDYLDQLEAAGFRKRADYHKEEYYRIAIITNLLRDAVVRLIL